MHGIVLVDVPDILNNILVRHMLVGLLPGERQYLPQGHGEGPHIRFSGELSL